MLRNDSVKLATLTTFFNGNIILLQLWLLTGISVKSYHISAESFYDVISDTKVRAKLFC